MPSSVKDNEQGDGLTDQPQQEDEEQQQQEEAEEEQKQDEGEMSGADNKGKHPIMVLSASPSTTPGYSTSFFTEYATDDGAYDDVNPSSAKKRKVGPHPNVNEYWESVVAAPESEEEVMSSSIVKDQKEQQEAEENDEHVNDQDQEDEENDDDDKCEEQKQEKDEGDGDGDDDDDDAQKKEAEKRRIDKGKQPMMVSSSSSPSTTPVDSPFGSDYKADDDYYDVDADVEKEENSAAKERKITQSTNNTIIIIEYWTACTDADCNADLERKAIMVKLELEHGISGIEVKINPELTIKGYNGLFRVRTEGGTILVDYGEQSNPRSDDVLLLDPYEFMLEVKEKVEKGVI